LYAALRPETPVEVHAKQTVASVGYNRFGREDVARRFAEVVHEDLPHSVASDALASFSRSPFHYKCTADGFSSETPLGEKFDAKFDGNYDPGADDPARTMVSAKLLNPNRVELTHKRKGKIVSISHMSVAAGGESIHVAFVNKESNTSTFDFQKQR
jgi:hypothetical protein